MKALALAAILLSSQAFAAAVTVEPSRISFVPSEQKLTIDVDDEDLVGRLVLKVNDDGTLENLLPPESDCPALLAGQIGTFALVHPVPEILARVKAPITEGLDLLIEIKERDLMFALIDAVPNAKRDRGWQNWARSEHLDIQVIRGFVEELQGGIKVHVDSTGNVFAGFRTP